MPELPEIEHLKRTLEPVLVGAAVLGVKISRRDVIHTGTARSGRITSRDLLAGCTITSLARRGKQLALLTDSGPCLCIHLGMSGQLRFVPEGARLHKADHVHCRWQLDGPAGCGTLAFRDPRRFGGIWVYPSQAALMQRWERLGPDALTITAKQLTLRLAGRNRPLKAALLDQHIIAGVGNIYADESLFTAGLHPLCIAAALDTKQIAKLAKVIRATLRGAVAAGGSTLRDYADGNGNAGWFAVQHRVYGRSGQPCTICGKPLTRLLVAQRTTVSCDSCQQRVG